MSFCGIVTDCSGELLTMESPDKLTQKAGQQTQAAAAPFTRPLQKLPAAAANIDVAAKAAALQGPPTAVRDRVAHRMLRRIRYRYRWHVACRVLYSLPHRRHVWIGHSANRLRGRKAAVIRRIPDALRPSALLPLLRSNRCNSIPCDT